KERNTMQQDTLNIFHMITELQGGAGNEKRARDYMKGALKMCADETINDNLGRVLGDKKEHGLRVMVAGHLDEVRYMVSPSTEDGMSRLQTRGGWWNQVMLAQRVQVMTKEGIIPGVIASTPPHLLTPEQRKKPMEVKEMLIDLGADDREDAKKIGVEPGDAIL